MQKSIFPVGARRTLAAPATLSGVGIHTGHPATVTLHPAEFGQGVVFQVTHEGGVGVLPAQAAYVTDTTRCTTLTAPGGGTSLLTIEHLLSAFAGLGITDAMVEVNGPEMPIGDGGAAFWVEAIRGAGIVDATFSAEDAAATDRLRLALTAACGPDGLLVKGRGGSFLAAYPAERFRATVAVSFDHPLIDTQVARFDVGEGDYAADIAPARTFGFIEEVEALLKAGLARGGSFDNALVIYPDHYSSPLRFANEPARHKLLDLMGDLFLAGLGPCPPVEVFAVKPSHRLNVELARLLAERVGANG